MPVSSLNLEESLSEVRFSSPKGQVLKAKVSHWLFVLAVSASSPLLLQELFTRVFRYWEPMPALAGPLVPLVRHQHCCDCRCCSYYLITLIPP